MAKKPKHGFLDYVRNPRLFREEVREMNHANAAAAPRSDRLVALVAAMYTRRLEYEEHLQFLKAGKKIIPLLGAALRDPKFLFHRYGESVADGSAMETALELLEPFAEPSVEVLEPALSHEDERFRSRALYHLAQCGADDSISALKVGLQSPSEMCRSYALMGLEFLNRTGRGSKLFRGELFDAALPLLDDKEYNPAEHAPRVLLVLDRERAIEVLLSEEVLRANNRNVRRTLQALEAAKVPVPGHRLRKLLSAIRSDAAGGYPFDYAYADGLILLARAEGQAAADVIEDARELGSKLIDEAAARAKAIIAGVEDAYAYVMSRFERKGAAGLSKPQRYYLTLCWLDSEVKNGGFTQYFFNSSGDLAGNPAEAANAVGAAKAADIIRNAVAVFGPNGPHSSRDVKMEQLSKIDLAILEKLSTEYFGCPDNLRELLPLYVADHAREFRGPRRRR